MKTIPSPETLVRPTGYLSAMSNTMTRPEGLTSRQTSRSKLACTSRSVIADKKPTAATPTPTEGVLQAYARYVEKERGLVLKTQNNPENNRTGQGVAGCSPVLSLYGENREQPALDTDRCSGTVAEKPNGKTLRSCPSCGSFSVYMEPSGKAICQTCEAGA